jgi:hypothetical protein
MFRFRRTISTRIKHESTIADQHKEASEKYLKIGQFITQCLPKYSIIHNKYKDELTDPYRTKRGDSCILIS